MKRRKQSEGPLPVLNVLPEIYDIFEVTGFRKLLDVHKRFLEMSVEGCGRLYPIYSKDQIPFICSFEYISYRLIVL